MKSYKNIRIIVGVLTIILLLISTNSYSSSYSNNKNDLYIVLKLDNKTHQFNKLNSILLFPGIEGRIHICINNNYKDKDKYSYNINFADEENKPANLRFIFNNKEYKYLTEINKDIINIQNKNEITIKYKWDYETGNTINEIINNDYIDTLDSNKTYRFCIKLDITENDNTSSDKNLLFNVLPRTGTIIKNFKNRIINMTSIKKTYLLLSLLSLIVIIVLLLILGHKIFTNKKENIK